MIKKIKIELVIFIILLANIILSYKADLSIYNYFLNLNYGVDTTYLKNFFIKITELGDSLWYFSIFLLILTVSFVGKNLKIIVTKHYLLLRNFSFFSLAAFKASEIETFVITAETIKTKNACVRTKKTRSLFYKHDV